MQAGDCFRHVEREEHVWVVISDPNLDKLRVLVVNFTTWKPYKDQACILDVGDHPFIQWKTCVSYPDARVCSVLHLMDLENRGRIKILPSVEPSVLQRIREGAGASIHMELQYGQILIDQGLI